MKQAEECRNDMLALRLQELEKENAMLKRILDQHGISYSVSVESSTIEQPTHIVTVHTIRLSLQEKVAIFQNLFKGRDDVFAKRWYSPSSQKQDISLCVKENGAEIIVTRENTNVQIAQTGSLHICHTMISSTILQEKINLDVTLSVFIQYAKIIPVTFYVLILMTRIVNMAIRMMFLRSLMSAIVGTYHVISNVLVLATERMFGYSLINQ